MRGALPSLVGSTSSREWAQELRCRGLVTQGLRCPPTYGIFPDQGLNLWLLHCQGDSQPPRQQGGPSTNLVASVKSFISAPMMLDGARETAPPVDAVWGATLAGGPLLPGPCCQRQGQRRARWHPESPLYCLGSCPSPVFPASGKRVCLRS